MENLQLVDEILHDAAATAAASGLAIATRDASQFEAAGVKVVRVNDFALSTSAWSRSIVDRID